MHERHDTLPPLALSMGEPGGIGPDIALLAWEQLHRAPDVAEAPAFCFVGPAALLQGRAELLGLNIPLRPVESMTEAADAFSAALPVLQAKNIIDITDAAGKALPENAPAVLASIEHAVRLTLAGEAAGVVTLPIQKESLYHAGFRFEGHTDYLADLAQRLDNLPQRPTPVMMLAAQDLRTVPVTIHIPLEEVPTRLSADSIIRQGRIVAHDLRRFFGISNPRLAVSGLNPHAGEGGRMGRQEETIIRPAIEALRKEGIDAFGPLPADTMFHAEARAQYDAALCMYHDQALIPVKTLDFHGGVNITLGLSFVRTSPDHGTALELAGSGKARPDSLIAALKLAARMSCAARRKRADS